MTGHCDLHSRLFVLICAAVMLFIMCSHAARANSEIPLRHNGVKRNVLRRLNAPHSQHYPLSVGGSEMRGSFRDTLPIINHQSHPVQFTQGSTSYSQNNGDNGQPRVKMIKLQRDGVRPARNSRTGYTLHGGQNFQRWHSRNNDYSLPQKAEQVGAHNSYPAVIRNPISAGKVHTSDSSKVDEGKYVGKTFQSNVFPPQTSRHWSTPPLTTRGRYNGFKETNVPPVAGTQSASNGAQTSKVDSLTSQTGPQASSLGNNLEATFINRNPSQEKQSSPVTDFSQRLNSVSSRGIQRYKVQSKLLKDSPTQLKALTGEGREALGASSNAATLARKQSLSAAQEHSKSSSSFKLVSKMESTKADAVTQFGGRKQSFTKYQSSKSPTLHITAQSPSQASVRFPLEESKHLGSFVLSPNAHSWDSHDTSRDKVVPVRRVNAMTRELTHDNKPGRPTKGIYRFREFINPVLQPVKEPSGSSPTERANSQQSSLDKGLDYRLKNPNTRQFSSQKYSFGRRAKLEKMDIHSPSPGAVDVIQLTTVSTPRPFTTDFKYVHNLLPESDASVGRNTTQTKLKLYKGVFDLEGFGIKPLEGAKTLARGPDTTVMPKPDLEGFKNKSLQTWQPNGIRIYRQYNKGETKPGSSSNSMVRQNELSSDDFKPLSKAAGSDGSTPRLPADEKDRKANASLGFRSVKNKAAKARNRMNRKNAKQNPVTASDIVSSSNLRSAGRLKGAPRPTSRLRAANENKPVPEGGVLLRTPTSSTVRGRRVKLKPSGNEKLKGSTVTNATGNAAIVRLPKRSNRFKGIAYADILGSASFISVRGSSLITPTDKEHSPNITTVKGGWTVTSDDGRNVSRRSETNALEEKEDIRYEVNKDTNSEVRTPDLYLDHEGSRGFNLTEVLSTVPGSRAAANDLSELDYLRISTENISFKSANRSHSDQQQKRVDVRELEPFQ